MGPSPYHPLKKFHGSPPRDSKNKKWVPPLGSPSFLNNFMLSFGQYLIESNLGNRNITLVGKTLLSDNKQMAMSVLTALRNPNMPAADLALGFNSPYEDVAHATLNHPRLLPFSKVYGLNSPHESVALEILRNHSSDIDLIHALTSRHESIGMETLDRPDLPDEDLHYGFDSPHESVGLATLDHPNLPIEDVEHALSSPHESVRERARQILSGNG